MGGHGPIGFKRRTQSMWNTKKKHAYEYFLRRWFFYFFQTLLQYNRDLFFVRWFSVFVGKKSDFWLLFKNCFNYRNKRLNVLKWNLINSNDTINSTWNASTFTEKYFAQENPKIVAAIWTTNDFGFQQKRNRFFISNRAKNWFAQIWTEKKYVYSKKKTNTTSYVHIYLHGQQ